MLQHLTNLFFGSLADVTQEPVLKSTSVEKDEEDWLLVNVPDGEASVEFNIVTTRLISRSNTENTVASVAGSDSMENPEVALPHSTGRVSRGSQAGALSKLVQVGRLQQAQARADRCGLSHRCIRRQNHVHQRLPRHASRTRPLVLQQPSHRNFCH